MLKQLLLAAGKGAVVKGAVMTTAVVGVGTTAAVAGPSIIAAVTAPTSPIAATAGPTFAVTPGPPTAAELARLAAVRSAAASQAAAASWAAEQRTTPPVATAASRAPETRADAPPAGHAAPATGSPQHRTGTRGGVGSSTSPTIQGPSGPSDGRVVCTPHGTRLLQPDGSLLPLLTPDGSGASYDLPGCGPNGPEQLPDGSWGSFAHP